MKPASVERERPSVGRGLLIVALDVVGAGAVAFYVWHTFGVLGQSDSYPPICTNSYGTVDCSVDGPVRAAAFTLFLVLLFGSIWIQRRRRII